MTEQDTIARSEALQVRRWSYDQRLGSGGTHRKPHPANVSIQMVTAPREASRADIPRPRAAAIQTRKSRL